MTTIERTRHAYTPNLPRPCTPINGGGLMVEAVLAAALTLTQKQILHSAAIVPAKYQPFTTCIVARESHGNYRAKGDVSSARGKFQFLDKQWRRGLSFMSTERLMHFGMPKKQATQIRHQLQAKPIDKWMPVLQDVAYASVITRPGGYRHWILQGSKCNRLAVK